MKNLFSKNLFSSSKKIREKVRKAKKESSRKWLSRHLNDPYVLEAQKRGYRSRAAFKLLQINQKFSLLRPGIAILDLGCSPGGWLQVTKDNLGVHKSNLIIGIDLLSTDKMKGTEIIKGDFRDLIIKNHLENLLDGRKLDGVISDMAADTTGHRPTDHLRTTLLLEEALEFSINYLISGGFFLAKCFKGGTEKETLKVIKKNFHYVKHLKPDASRKESVESYVLGLGFTNNIICNKNV